MPFTSNPNLRAHTFPFSVQDMWVYMTEDAQFSGWKSEEGLVWTETNIPYAAKGPEGQRALEITYHPSEVRLHSLLPKCRWQRSRQASVRAMEGFRGFSERVVEGVL